MCRKLLEDVLHTIYKSDVESNVDEGILPSRVLCQEDAHNKPRGVEQVTEAVEDVVGFLVVAG